VGETPIKERGRLARIRQCGEKEMSLGRSTFSIHWQVGETPTLLDETPTHAFTLLVEPRDFMKWRSRGTIGASVRRFR
jgi:hypothetical protein